VTRLRRVLVLLALVVVVGVSAGVSVLDPFHLRHIAWFTAGLVALAILLLTAFLAALAPRGVIRFLLVLLGVVALGFWGVVVWTAAQISAEGAVVGQTEQAGHRLLVLRGSGYTVDPVFAVVVRSGDGVFEQQSLVYQGLEQAPQPEAHFVDARTVEVRVGTACVYRSSVEDVTLDVQPVHRPIVPGC